MSPKFSRRTLLKFLASVPILGTLVPAPPVMKEVVESMFIGVPGDLLLPIVHKDFYFTARTIEVAPNLRWCTRPLVYNERQKKVLKEWWEKVDDV